MKRSIILIALVLAIMLLAGCVPDAIPADRAGDDAAGFWSGLWHGAIALFSFIISLFNKDVGIYEVNNTGGWYDFGYILGILMFWGGGSGGAAKSRKR